MIYINKKYIVGNKELKEILQALGSMDRIENAKNIVIKPNFASGTSAEAKSHIVTDINFIGMIVKGLLDINKHATLYLAESDSTGYGFTFLKFEHFNLPGSLTLNEEEKKRVVLLDLSRDRLKRINNMKLSYFITEDRQLWLSNELLSADIVVNMSNLKTHTVTGYTGACKNLFGCLPDSDKSRYHPHIHDVIYDLVLILQPQINIVDGFYAMQRNGPVNGEAVDLGYRVWSDSPIEADLYASSLVGLCPDKIKYLKRLKKTQRRNITTIAIKEKSDAIRKADLFVRLMNRVGLIVQRLGAEIERLGHRLHVCHNVVEVGIALVRPILILYFDIQKLRHLKQRVLRDYVDKS